MSSIPEDAARPAERRPHISDTEETAAASTARAGDLVHTVIGWLVITLVRVHDTIGAIEIFTTNNIGGGQAWMHRADEQLLFRRGNLRHPTWCSIRHCLALDPRASVHRSEPARIEPLGVGDPTIELSVQQDSEEPLETATVSLVVTFDATIMRNVADVRGYVLDRYQVRKLLAELSAMADALGGTA
jgi:hypothetical protein